MFFAMFCECPLIFVDLCLSVVVGSQVAHLYEIRVWHIRFCSIALPQNALTKFREVNRLEMFFNCKHIGSILGMSTDDKLPTFLDGIFAIFFFKGIQIIIKLA